MNKSKIDWCQRTWNPVTGCTHICPYCYARELAETRLARIYGADGRPPYEPRYWPEKLSEPSKLKTPAHIFCVSMGDLFCEDMATDWILKILHEIQVNQQHTFTILTKNPKRAVALFLDSLVLPKLLPNLILGTSITGAMDAAEQSRVNWVRVIPQPIRRVLSIEPMLHYPGTLGLDGFDWVIVGGQTGRESFQPSMSWLWGIHHLVKPEGIPLFIKHNVGYPEVEFAREYPEGVPHG